MKFIQYSGEDFNTDWHTNILDGFKRDKKEMELILSRGRYPRGSKLSEYQLNTLKKRLNEVKEWIKNRENDLKKAEWDRNHIIKELDVRCKYDECGSNQTQYVIMPENHNQYAKHTCMKCGRWQKWLSEKTFMVECELND